MPNPVKFTCQFTDPKRWDGTTPDNYGHQWQFMGETCTYNGAIYAPGTTTASSTDIQLYASFTAGEVLTILLMFILIVIELAKMLARALDKIKTKKKYLGYHGGDVEVRDEL